ncbi:type II toxin-antitoxin system RelE/ParE family toxin [Castellaniella sp.]|uniref:type II toxin-antitoxin system RelE/ParE family toxin n=1 Tax=Castellaniella sp. TaxID=1955812 RepID=UPI00356A0E08
MSRTLLLTDNAEADLAEIWSYVAEDSSEATANRLIATLYTTCEKILPFPESQPARPLIAPGLRVTFHGSYAIYYTHSPAAVTIIRVLHGARDIGRVIADGGFH